MNGKDVFRGMQHLDPKYIDQAEFGEFSQRAFERDWEGSPRRGRYPKWVQLAAVFALASLLVGCGIAYVLKIQDMKLGDRQVTQERWDENSQAFVYETVSQQVLTFSGIKGSPNYEAALEWYEFLQTYDPDYTLYHANKESDHPYEAPEAYAPYNIYTQEMQDQLDAITDTYGLKLRGKHVEAFSSDALLSYLNLTGVLLPEAKAAAEDFNVSYYDGGWFQTDMDMTLTDCPDWPYQFLCSLYYSPKDCFDPSRCELNDTSDWQEWNYTTASGAEVLVIRSPSVWYSWAFCDRGDATVTVRVETIREIYSDNDVTRLPMTDGQLKQVLDAIDFSIRPQPGDPALLEAPAFESAPQTQNGYTVAVKDVVTDGHAAKITLSIPAPEDVDLEQYLGHGNGSTPRLNFTHHRLDPAEEMDTVGGGGSFAVLADNDGKRNTIDYMLDMSADVEDGIPFPEGSRWNLYLEDLSISQWNSELHQNEFLWELEGSWYFALAMVKGDWREIQFIQEPIDTPAVIGWDLNGKNVVRNVTLTSLSLRAFGGNYDSTWDLGSLDFSDYENGQFLYIVLKDGTRHQLDQFVIASEDWAAMTPLGEIEYLEMMDGLKLYPVE